MGNYFLSKYGIGKYGEENSSYNIFFEWLSNSFKAWDSEKNQLERFCAIFSYSFLETKTLIDNVKNFTSIKECPVEFLSYLSYLIIGEDYDYSLIEKDQRKKVFLLSKLFKNKGNLSVLKFLIEKLYNWNVVFQEGFKNVFFTNDKNSLLLDFNETEYINNYGTPYDTIHYLWHTTYEDNSYVGHHLYEKNGLGIWLYISDTETEDLVQKKLNSLNKILKLFLPVNVFPILFFNTNYIENYLALWYNYIDEIYDNFNESLDIEGCYMTKIENKNIFYTNTLNYTNTADTLFHIELSYNLNFYKEA